MEQWRLRQVVRRRLVDRLSCVLEEGARIIFVEGQAGQGKTTLVRHLFAHLGVTPAWYALNPPDRDPLHFLAGVHSSLRQAHPEFKAPHLEEVLGNSDCSFEQLPLAVDLLLQGVAELSPERRFLVFDDVHRLGGDTQTADLLRRLVEDDRSKMLMLSRESVATAIALEYPTPSVWRLANRELAFSVAEIGDLYNEVFGTAITTEEARQLARQTEGWTMGLLLLAPAIEADRNFERPPRSSPSVVTGGQISEYFCSQILGGLSKGERDGLIALALFDTIPIELVEQMFPDIHLYELADRILFLRPLEGHDDHYTFHHLFQDSLRGLAEMELDDGARAVILTNAAQWHRERGDVETALRYLLRAGGYRAVDELAGAAGLDLVVRNRLVTLHDLIRDLPGTVFSEYPWLSYYRAVSLLNSDPPRAYGYLTGARKRFLLDDNGQGELLAIAQLLSFHLSVDAQYPKMEEMLIRADALFSLHENSLPVPLKVQCAQFIGLGHILANGNFDEGLRYAELAFKEASRHKLDSATVTAVTAKAYAWGIKGDWAQYAATLEGGVQLLASRYVNTFNKTQLKFTCLNLLSLKGDHANYYAKEFEFRAQVRANLVARTVFSPFLAIWDCDMAIADGRYEDASKIIGGVLTQGEAVATPQMYSQYLQYSGYLAAITGDTAVAERNAMESRRLRQAIGSPWHTQLNHLLIGASFARIGKFTEASHHLNASLALAEQNHEQYLSTAACLQLAYLHLLRGDITAAQASLREGLGRMRANNYVYFFSWEPQMMRRLLTAAVAEGIEPDIARRLAAERLDLAIRNDGSAFPQLHLRTLGGLAFELSDGRRMGGDELTPIQREIVGLLAASPDATISYESLQLALWPDGEPKKVRARLDTHIARLRKSLTSAFGEGRAGDYLPLEKKRLRLANCVIDAREFAQQSHQGLRHARRNEYWQAGNAFRLAHLNWKGRFLPEQSIQGQFRDELDALYIKSVRHWAKALRGTGEEERVSEVLADALHWFPADDTIVRLLYDTHAARGDRVQARKVLRAYEEALRRQDYTVDEIDEFINAFWRSKDGGT